MQKERVVEQQKLHILRRGKNKLNCKGILLQESRRTFLRKYPEENTTLRRKIFAAEKLLVLKRKTRDTRNFTDFTEKYFFSYVGPSGFAVNLVI